MYVTYNLRVFAIVKHMYCVCLSIWNNLMLEIFNKILPILVSFILTECPE
jgi:hypothetical protein